MSNGKTYRTAGGQQIDMERLIIEGEMTRAVGNMGTNARGDIIDNKNKPIEKRAAQVQKGYRKQIGNVAVDAPVATSKKDQLKHMAETIKGLDEPVVEPTVEKPKPKPKARKKKAEETREQKGGLAEAIAKARDVKQEPDPTPREKERNQTGVKKI